MNDERGPYLPLDRVLVRSVEALELKGLLQFFEEKFDRPPALVEIRDGSRRPGEVVRDKHHLPGEAIDLDYRPYASERLRVLLARVKVRQGDDFVADDAVAEVVRRHGFYDLAPERDLFPRNEMDADLVHLAEPVEIEVAAVSDHDVSGFQAFRQGKGFR